MADENRFIQLYDSKKRARLINKEKKRLEGFFGEKDDLASGLIDQAAVQRSILHETSELIKRDGVVEEYKNGENQYGRKKSSAAEVYAKFSAEYVKTISALANIRGIDGSEADDEFLKFIKGQKR